MPAGLDGNPDPVRSPARDAVLHAIVSEILGLNAQRPCIGIDGPPGSGKSTLADELAAELRARSVEVVRSTTDSFHHPRAVRYRLGRASARGYYRDSHDLDAFTGLLLDPWREGLPIRSVCFDEPSDTPVDSPAGAPPPSGVLIVDGLFLHRAELRRYWHFSIFLHTPQRTRRGIEQARARVGPERFEAFVQRYVGGWQLYLDECDPARLATRIVDNDDLHAPAFAYPGSA